MRDGYSGNVVRHNGGSIVVACAALVLGGTVGYGAARGIDMIAAEGCRRANPPSMFSLSPDAILELGIVGARMIHDSKPAHFITEHTSVEGIVASINADTMSKRVAIEIPFVEGERSITADVLASAALAGEVIRDMSSTGTIVESPTGVSSDVPYPAKWIQVTVSPIC